MGPERGVRSSAQDVERHDGNRGQQRLYQRFAPRSKLWPRAMNPMEQFGCRDRGDAEVIVDTYVLRDPRCENDSPSDAVAKRNALCSDENRAV